MEFNTPGEPQPQAYNKTTLCFKTWEMLRLPRSCVFSRNGTSKLLSHYKNSRAKFWGRSQFCLSLYLRTFPTTTQPQRKQMYPGWMRVKSDSGCLRKHQVQTRALRWGSACLEVKQHWQLPGVSQGSHPVPFKGDPSWRSDGGKWHLPQKGSAAISSQLLRAVLHVWSRLVPRCLWELFDFNILGIGRKGLQDTEFIGIVRKLVAKQSRKSLLVLLLGEGLIKRALPRHCRTPRKMLESRSDSCCCLPARFFLCHWFCWALEPQIYQHTKGTFPPHLLKCL